MKMVSLLVGGKYVEELPIVEGIFEYFLLLVASCDDVIKGAFVFNSRFPCHDMRIANILKGVNSSIFKSDPFASLLLPYVSRETLFANAELVEDAIKNLFGGCFSHHLSQGIKGRSDFEGNELERGPLFQTIQAI